MARQNVKEYAVDQYVRHEVKYYIKKRKLMGIDAKITSIAPIVKDGNTVKVIVVFTEETIC